MLHTHSDHFLFDLFKNYLRFLPSKAWFVDQCNVNLNLCLFHLLVQKLFLPPSNFFEHVQYISNVVKFSDHGQTQDFT